VPPWIAYRSVRQPAVPPIYSSTVVAAGLDASILPVSILNSSSVMSLVQHMAEARSITSPVSGSITAGVKGCVHLAASSGMARMLVVVCRSHWEWRHTSSRSLVKVTSHSTMPAPMRAAAT